MMRSLNLDSKADSKMTKRSTKFALFSYIAARKPEQTTKM